MTFATLRLNKTPARATPARTPRARLWGVVSMVTAKVITITALSLLGIFRKLRNPATSAVLTAIPIMTATKAAMGICLSQVLPSKIIAKRLIPEDRVERRVRPPLSMFMTDCPTNAQPAIPPNKEDTMLAIPWPFASVFLFELESVLSSRMS